MASSDTRLAKYFKYITPLPEYFYTQEPYKTGKLRRCKSIVLYTSMLQCQAFRDLKTDQQSDLVSQIEKGCLKNTLKKANETNINKRWENPAFRLMYSSTVSDLAEALDVTQNTYLMPKVLSGEILAIDLGSMDPLELCSTHADLAKKVDERKQAGVSVKTTTLYACPSCNKKEAFMQELQLRAGDENKDTQLFCMFCSYEWLERN